jgi:hypothetical protein
MKIESNSSVCRLFVSARLFGEAGLFNSAFSGFKSYRNVDIWEIIGSCCFDLNVNFTVYRAGIICNDNNAWCIHNNVPAHNTRCPAGALACSRIFLGICRRTAQIPLLHHSRGIRGPYLANGCCTSEFFLYARSQRTGMIVNMITNWISWIAPVMNDRARP